MPRHNENCLCDICADSPSHRCCHGVSEVFERRNKPDANEWTSKHVLDHFNEFSVLDKELMLDVNDKGWSRHLATAKAWLWDHGLRGWVYGQNRDKGVAPANEHV